MDAQNPAPPTTSPQPAPPTSPGSPTPSGQVLIQSHGDPPPGPGEPGYPAAAANRDTPQQPITDETAKADITDADRSALLITAYDLDARLSPARSALSMRAQLTVRNTGKTPLKQLALQISSTLHWDSATLVAGTTRTRLALAQHQLETDADHTGAETEAILPLPEPLGPGQPISLDLFYSGTVTQGAGRLQRLGASAGQQQATDWDAISPAWTGLRGFGNVLWYPVAAPQLFLGEGNALFEATGQARLREQTASVHLRLSVEYAGGAPAEAYFCGHRQAFATVLDDPDTPIESGSGVARAEFSPETLGFRTPSLFVLALPETFPTNATPPTDETAEHSSSSSSNSSEKTEAPPIARPESQTTPFNPDPAAPPFLAVVGADAGATASFSAAADHVAPLLREWLGVRPLSALTAIDHAGQPFQDGPLLVAPLAVLGASPQNAALVQSLTHAWVQTGQPWIDEGLPQFFSLLWTERGSGRPAANAALDELMRPVALAEPDLAAGPNPSAISPLSQPPSQTQTQPAGQPLIAASDDLFYRRKAAAVWWMLRGIAGDGNLHQALSAWRSQPASQAPAAEQALAFEHLLEKLSGKDLGWFFADWVLRDRGLPDLTLTDVAAVQQPATTGHPSGWIVAVTVRNEGGAVADVPVTVHSAVNRVEQRIRIPGFSTVTQRVLVETPPTSVDVNDGGTPELRSSTHTREINLQVR